MKNPLKKTFVLSSMIFSSLVFSQDMTFDTFGFNRNEFDRQSWATSTVFDTKNPSIIIPFTFPAEARLYSESRLDTNSVFQDNQSPTASFRQNSFQIPQLNLLSYSSAMVAPDSAGRVYGNNSLSPFVGYGGGVTYMYIRKNLGLNLDLSLRLAGNSGNHAVAESAVTNLTLSYKIASNLFNSVHYNPKMNVFLQLSETSKFKLSDLRDATAAAPGKEYFIKPGFSIYTKSIVLEGLIKVPVDKDLQSMTFDRLRKAEGVSGSLGLKWFIPEN